MSEHALKACHCCGLVQQLPPLAPRERALCRRCGTLVWDHGRGAARNPMVLGAALAALILYPLAIGLPIMSLEKFGHHTDASIWSGSVGLLREGEYLVGGVVLLCSVVLPLAKLLGLILIVCGTGLRERHRALTYHWVEMAGRWGMLDVLLIAVVVAWLKVGDLVEVHASEGALIFTTCVSLSLLASAWFDPHALWESEAPQLSSTSESAPSP